MEQSLKTRTFIVRRIIDQIEPEDLVDATLFADEADKEAIPDDGREGVTAVVPSSEPSTEPNVPALSTSSSDPVALPATMSNSIGCHSRDGTFG